MRRPFSAALGGSRLSTTPSVADIKRSLLFHFNGPLARRWVSVKSLATLLVAPFSPTCFRGGIIKRERMKGADKRWEGEGRIQWFLPSVWILVLCDVMKMVRSFELGRVLLTTLNGRVTQSEIYNSIASSHMQIDLRLSSFALSSHFA